MVRLLRRRSRAGRYGHRLGAEEGVIPFGLHKGQLLVAYRELWPDQEDATVELARLIVDPGCRGQGIGRVLAAELAAQTRSTYPQYPDTIMRVYPENTAALRSYVAAGFVRVSPEQEAAWNAPHQPVQYVWLAM
jgi:ribosomal protein S18 acetylase RimI-like enzyme